jgi:hypothetical protein
MNSMQQMAAMAMTVATPVMLFACAHRQEPVVAEQTPGVPAYWESELPREPARGAQRTGTEESPQLTDGGAPDAPLPGQSDPFLWENDATLKAPPDAQIPLRSHEPEESPSPSAPFRVR